MSTLLHAMENRGPRSLGFLAQKACMKYVKRIDDVGDCPYDLIRPVLMKLESPDQLHQLELNSPQLVGKDDEIWLQFIKRDIPGWESKPHRPKNPKNWFKLYKKLKEQLQRDRNQGAEKLKAAMDSLNDAREQNLAKVVSHKDLPQEPINPKNRTTPSYIPKIRFAHGHKLSLLEKIRQETRNKAVARMSRPSPKKFDKPAEIIKKAPKALVEDCKRSVQQKILASSASAPRLSKPPLATSKQEKLVADKVLQEREDRLQALKEGRSTTTTATQTKTTNRLPIQPASKPPVTKPRPLPSQRDGVDDEDLAEMPPPDIKLGSRPTKPINSTPAKRRIDPQPVPTYSSPVPPPPKRKAEPSIFMTTKRPKVTR